MEAALSLPRSERRRIEKLAHRTKEAIVLVRCRIVLKVAMGCSRRRAGREIGCAPSTAWQIVTRFLKEGEASLVDRRCDNGDLKVDEDTREGIRQILQKTPEDFGERRPTWTLELLARVIVGQLGIGISVGHLWRVLRDMGVRWGRPKPMVRCPWPRSRRERRLRALRRLAETPAPREAVVYADEVDIHLNPKIGPDWMLPGMQRWVWTPGQNAKAYAAGAYDPHRNRMVYVEGDRKASWLFLNLLQALLAAYRGMRRVHVILDNYGIHKSAAVAGFLRRCGETLRLHFLPPYCPDHNKIERIWSDVHANVTRNHRKSALRELLDGVQIYLARRFLLWVGTCVNV
jgi:transposase